MRLAHPKHKRPESNLVRQPQTNPFSARQFTRLAVLGCFTMLFAGIAVWSDFGGRLSSKRPTGVQTALAVSQFDEFGDGVIESQDPPGEPEREPDGTQAAFRETPIDKLDRRLLENMLDKTAALPARAYYHVAGIAAKSSTDEMRQAARQDIRFAHLWNEPGKYRGELVFLRGYLRELKRIEIEPEVAANEYFNPSGLTTLYEGYLFTDDSRPNPYVVIVPEIAPEMPLGANISETVTFAGYFFKLWRYKSRDGVERAAPLVIGRVVSWTPAPKNLASSRLAAYFAAGLVLLVAAVSVAMWMLNRRRATGIASAEATDADLAGLAELERMDGRESR